MAQLVALAPVCPVRVAHVYPAARMVPDTITVRADTNTPALVDWFTNTLPPSLSWSYDSASDTVLDVVPTVSATRSVPGAEGLALHVMTLLDCQLLDSHPVAPPRVMALHSVPPYPILASTIAVADQ